MNSWPERSILFITGPAFWAQYYPDNDMKRKHYSTIAEYLADSGAPPPEHPFFTMISVSTNNDKLTPDCPDHDFVSTTDFYAISLKKVTEGEVLYGKTRYDCNAGTLMFLAPRQEFRTQGIKIQAEGRLILIHADYLIGHPLAEKIKDYRFFDYAINEALHLSPREESIISDLFDSISKEYNHGYDEHSRDIILAYLKTLLSYGMRFYKRQFIQRGESNKPLLDAFVERLSQHYDTHPQASLPVLQDIAQDMGFSRRYLSDALKSETGTSARDHMQAFILNRAKSLLLETDDSVTSIAYTLGFDYPQYFVRLFKKKNGMTPTEFRHRLN